jgi:transcriptional regulator with XRE-family HTH domain
VQTGFSGAALRRIRKAASLSQAELGHMIGRTEFTVCRYEQGVHSPQVEIVRRLASALRCDPGDFFESSSRSDDVGPGSGGREQTRVPSRVGDAT